MVSQRPAPAARLVEQLARWWTAASNEEKFRALKASTEGHEGAPPLDALRYAIYLAEAEAGQVAEVR